MVADMEGNKVSKLLLAILTVLILSNCTYSLDGYDYTKSIFRKYYSKKDITSHFPVKTGDKCYGYFFGPSSKVNFGDMYLAEFTTSEKIEEVKKEHFQYIDRFGSDKLFSIKIDLVRDSSEICRSGISNNFIPIADIESLNLGLGELEDSIYNPDIQKYIPISKYIMPKDLIVYVIEAKSGDYWEKAVIRQSRFSLLGKWKNGFSRGYAISEKEKILIYWVAAW
ncbi:MAG: hypothetical protein PHV20_07080 [Bacteroidales bacterium]|nr:hypothetical protein [Bacteroidales bacterium]